MGWNWGCWGHFDGSLLDIHPGLDGGERSSWILGVIDSDGPEKVVEAENLSDDGAMAIESGGSPTHQSYHISVGVLHVSDFGVVLHGLVNTLPCTEGEGVSVAVESLEGGSLSNQFDDSHGGFIAE